MPRNKEESGAGMKTYGKDTSRAVQKEMERDSGRRSRENKITRMEDDSS